MDPTMIKISHLLPFIALPDNIVWRPFFPGVEIHRIYGDGRNGPSAALLRFQPNGRVPLHEHTGYEHILVLSGSQEDENGIATAGALVVSAPGSRHSIVSREGCFVLAIYEKPVVFATA
jgi:anti-sigma factor ChrR (cupin superfamily)